jgi:hypothetical protein
MSSRGPYAFKLNKLNSGPVDLVHFDPDPKPAPVRDCSRDLPLKTEELGRIIDIVRTAGVSSKGNARYTTRRFIEKAIREAFDFHLRKCKTCKQYKPLRAFVKTKDEVFGRLANCYDCLNAKRRKVWKERKGKSDEG